MPNLPFQLGNTYVVLPGVTAHTRTIFSRRMQGPHQQVLAASLRRARNALTYTLGRIDHTLATLGPPANPAPAGGLAANFINVFIGRLNVAVATNADFRILLNLFKATCLAIQAGLRGPLEIVDMPIMSQGGNVAGYVRRYGATPGAPRGRIHLEFGALTANNDWTVAHTIVHEASHKFAHTVDHAYAHQIMLIANLTTPQLMNNADSVAAVVIDTYQQLLR